MVTINSNYYRTNRFTESYVELYNGETYQVVTRKLISIETVDGKNVIRVDNNFYHSHRDFFTE